jgi:type VI secretion system ImpB/VipA family protein
MAVELNLGTLETDAPALEAPGWDTPFRFAILGDFTGRANRGLTEAPDEIVNRKGKKIDRENFDEVLADFAPQLSLELDGFKGGPVELSFQTLEDFHADHIVAKVERFEDYTAAKDRVALLSAILHHADFKALEAAWRGLDWFLRKAWTGENGVEVLLYDLAESELSDCVNGADDLSQSPLYAWLVEKAQKGYNAQPWGALIGLYSFTPSAAHAQVLGRIAKIARHASAPFLAALGAPVWEKTYKPDKDDAAAWEALRKEPAAAMLGLTAPGFLLRPPYGVGTKPVEKIAYEEFKSTKDAAHYVLGNPALFCGALLAKSFTKKNWQFKPGSVLELDQMPMHVARDEDDQEVLVTVGVWMMQKSIDQLTKQGFMALRGVKGRNHVQLNRFLPLANAPVDQPSADLIGSWGQKALKGVPRTPSKPQVGVKTDMMSGDTGMSAVQRGAAGTVAARAGGFDTNNLDGLMAAADGYEARVKAEREAAEAAASGGDSSSSDFGSDTSSDMPSDMPSDLPSEEPALDPELAALLEDTPSEPAAEPASEEMDPELAALMASMDNPEPAAEAPAEAPNEEMDPELAALLKDMEDGK